jgi:GTP-binding protein
MLGWARTLGRQTLAVATKLDRIPRTRRAAQLAQIARTLEMPVEQVLGFSATERLGVDELWKALLAVTKVAPRTPPVAG